ncbi:MAG TPA: hypothetical protein VMG12_28145 [Polyangiaceae bacterium]|nr:hypothetical protein [Polyangiaceae bacterium]
MSTAASKIRTVCGVASFVTFLQLGCGIDARKTDLLLSNPDDAGAIGVVDTRPESQQLPDGGVADDEPADPDGIEVSIVAGGDGTFGRVISDPAGIDCSEPPCRARFARGTSVELMAQTSLTGGSGFAGWSGPCNGLDDCRVLLDGSDVSLVASYAPANIAFVTSTSSSGYVGGLTAADGLCAARAASAGLAGTFRAYLSTSSVNAIDRLGGARGWVRTDGRPLLDAREDVASGRLFYTLRFDEGGRDAGERVVWTGSGPDGKLAAAGAACNDWGAIEGASGNSGQLGNSDLGGTGLSRGASGPCEYNAAMFCFQVNRTVRIRPAPSPGRRAFVSAARFPVAGGIAAADALCRQDAASGNLSGSYRALLATSTASAVSRFDLSGPAWVRLDGIPIVANAADLFFGRRWEAPINLTPTGVYFDIQGAFVGGTSLIEPGALGNTCSDWTSTTGSVFTGRAGFTGLDDAYYAFVSACTVQVSLTCLEE